jgi:predicted DNA-binding transcriptional regulator AlpA
MLLTSQVALSTSALTAASSNPDDLLTTTVVRAALGNICDMTLWRWTRDLAFPAPDLVISRRKFWRRSTVQAWIAKQAAGRAANPGE